MTEAMTAALRHWRLGLLLLILSVGTGLTLWQPISLEALFDWGERWAAYPLIWLLVLLVQAVLFTFALPGSTLIWVVAPFLQPLFAVPVMVIGSTLGAIGARHVASKLSTGWQAGSKGEQVVKLLETRSDILTQIALRALPGFPHSVVNYAAGILRLPLPTYIAAAVIGLTCKWWVYAAAIHNLGAAARGEESVGFLDVLPLFVLVGLMLLAALIRRQWAGRSS